MRVPLAKVLVCVLATSSVRGEADTSFHFEHDIAPHLARAGCAAAECHGGATGRGGLKLSLFATNARADYEAITQDLDGRRIDYADPHRSLVLRKPTRQMKHKGGEVIDKESETYRALADWIADGAPSSRGESRSLVALELEPSGERFVVTATFAGPDGIRHSRDVTALARFESTDEQVASVDEAGRLALHGPGETWILAHYGSLIARHPVRRSFDSRHDPPDTAHALDDIWQERLSELGLEPGPPADLHRLLRRLYLDLTGRPPTPHEIDAFFAWPEASRVATTVDGLLLGKEFADQLTRNLWEWFEIPQLSEDLRHTSDRNARLRAMIREFAGRDDSLLECVTKVFQDPRHGELVQRFGDPRDRAEFTGRAFLGISIGCARCHNHPMDRWSQSQHLQFSAFFTDPRPVPDHPGMTAPGQFFLPGDGKAVEPVLLPVKNFATPEAEEGTRRTQLVRFLQDDAAGALARNAANRVFGILLGRHLVEAPDDHRLSNPAVHEPVLELLANKFRDGDYRLRPLIRFIVTSQLYALSSAPPDGEPLSGDPALRYLARREARPMSGDQFLRAASFVLGVSGDRQLEPAETPLSQQLHILNSGLLQEWLRRPGNQVDAIFAFETDPVRQLDQLYQLILTRPPRPAERREFLPLLESAEDPLAFGRDLAFALLAGREFSSLR